MKLVYSQGIAILIYVISLTDFPPGTSAGRAQTWYFCMCHWVPWSSWAECSSTCGGGYQQRDRKVWLLDKPGCDRKFERCASHDMGRDRRSCNNICYNNGDFQHYSSIYGYCSCKKGTHGKCCEQIVTCGQPSSISQGSFSGSDYSYDHEITYSCDTDYNMTASSNAVLSCNEYGSWSHTAPECLYAASCKSDPCQNQATCTNLLNGYQCSCLQGWTGKNCEIDVQPPVVDQCPEDKVVLTSDMTSIIEWREPYFHDPMGNMVQVTSNYKTNESTFPWGEHAVQYSAVKPSNGLTMDCVFNVTVKPYPCQPLDPPMNGYTACNDWMAEYANICKVGCKNGYTLTPEFKLVDWYNCGATGRWFPSSRPIECIKQVIPNLDENVISDTIPLVDCSDLKQINDMKRAYVKDLRDSNFNSLCVDHMDSCKAENVNMLTKC